MLQSSYASSAPLRRIGLLDITTASGYATRWAVFRQALKRVGWVDGQQIEFVQRFAEYRPERLPALAAELMAASVEVLVTHDVPGAKAASGVADTVPIVVAAVADPVAAGLVASYARPGGNTTGTAFPGREIAAKRLQLLKEALPRAARVAVLSNPRNPVYSQAVFDAMQGVAGSLGLELQRHDVAEPMQFARLFEDIAARRPDAVVVTEEAMFNANAAELATLALKHRLPAVGAKDFSEAGGLVGYGADFSAMFGHAAHLVDRLLRGTRAAELPVQQPKRFELAANARTARALGIELPNALLMRADALLR